MSSCKSCETFTNPAVACPTRMSDGRAFTDYRPRCAVNGELMTRLGTQGQIQSSYDARMYLQKNAQLVMEEERERAMGRLIPCAPCKRPNSDPGTMLPERYVVRCDSVSCTRTEVNPYGLGDGRKY